MLKTFFLLNVQLNTIFADNSEQHYTTQIDPGSVSFSIDDVIFEINKNQVPAKIACEGKPGNHTVAHGYELIRCDDDRLGLIQAVENHEPADSHFSSDFKSVMHLPSNKFTYRQTDKVIIPYQFDGISASRLPELRENIQIQIEHIEKYTCLKFEERNSAHSIFNLPYIAIQSDGNSGCMGGIGWWASQNSAMMNLDEGCDFTFVHETGHNLGYYHEHSRPDRRSNLRFNHQHETSAYWINYDKIDLDASMEDLEDHDVSYDGNSELHYGTNGDHGEMKFSNVFGQSARKNRVDPEGVDFYSQDPTFQEGWSLSRFDIRGWNLDHNCYEKFIPRNTPLRFRNADSSVVIDNVIITDDDRLDLTTAINIAGSPDLSQTAGKSVGLIFNADGSFEIRDAFSSNSWNCYSITGGTRSCENASSGWNGSDYVLYLSAIKETSILVPYDETSHQCVHNGNRVDCDLSNLSTYFITIPATDINDVTLENGVHSRNQADNTVLIPADNFCDYKNGFCEHYCEQGHHSRTCSCAPGWRLLTDGRSCEEINECDTPEQSCGNVLHSGAYCLNIYGRDVDHQGFQCRCDWLQNWDSTSRSCVSQIPQTEYEWFRVIDIDTDRCITVDSRSSAKLATCNSIAMNQVFRQNDQGQIINYDGKCLSQAGRDYCNEYGPDVSNFWTGPGFVTCVDNEPSQIFSMHVSGNSMKIISSCELINDWTIIYPLSGSSVYIGATSWARNSYPWSKQIVPENDVDSWISFEMSDFNDSESAFSTVDSGPWCSENFQRTYTVDMNNDGNDEIICIDHTTGIIQAYDFTDTELGDVALIESCIADPLLVKVFQGPFSNNITLLCLDEYDSNNPIVQWCQDSEYSGTLISGDFNNDGFQDLGCYHFLGPAEFVYGSAELNSINDFNFPGEARTMPRTDDFMTPYVGNFNVDNRLDILFTHAATGQYASTLQITSAPPTWTAPTSLTEHRYCLDVDPARDNYWYCSQFEDDCNGGAQYFSWAHSNCHKTCGNCVGTDMCKNDRTDCSRIKKLGACTEFANECRLSCGLCTATYAALTEPVFSDSNWAQTLSSETRYCEGANKNVQIADVNNDGMDDVVCHDWVTGELSYVALVDGVLSLGNPVTIYQDFCKSKYIRDASTQVDMHDQATGRFHILEIDGDIHYVCFARTEQKIYSTYESRNLLSIVNPVPDSLFADIILTAETSEYVTDLAEQVFENIIEHETGSFTTDQANTWANLRNHGCWCRGFDPTRVTGGSPFGELDTICRDYSQCMTCSEECEFIELEVTLVRNENGDLVCDDDLSDCMYEKCLCMTGFSNQVKMIDWESILIDDNSLFVGATCDASSGGDNSNGDGGNGVPDSPSEMCARRRKKRALFSLP